jgi:hypothetical protein
MRRVLKPTGLCFVNTELLQKKEFKRYKTYKSIWKEVAGGCNLNRNTSNYKDSGFKILN